MGFGLPAAIGAKIAHQKNSLLILMAMVAS